LGKRTLQSDGLWVQHRVNFTAPPDINMVAIGPDCAILNPDTPLVDSTTFADFYVYYLDDVNLLPTKELLLPAVQTISGNRCAGDSLLKAPALPGATYQWYRDSLAIPGADGQSYGVPPGGEGFYNVRVTTTDTCFVTEAFYYGRSGLSKIRLPQDTIFCKGEPLMLAPAVDGISYRWDGRAGDAISVNKEGIYKITASDLNGCTRNFTVTVRERDCNAPVYLPDAFTPNGDGRNDVFRIPPGSTIRLLEFSIYNRWGERVFTTKNKSTGWTGLNGSKRCEAGTYVYVLRVQKNNQPTTVSGTVTLIR
jgi:gliding motility-associated-like protein